MGKRKLFWVTTLALLMVASLVSAQSVPDIFGPAARAIDQSRMNQSIGIVAMIVFTILVSCAFWFKNMKFAIGAVFIIAGTVVWYGGGDIARTIIPTSGTAIAP